MYGRVDYCSKRNLCMIILGYARLTQNILKSPKTDYTGKRFFKVRRSLISGWRRETGLGRVQSYLAIGPQRITDAPAYDRAHPSESPNAPVGTANNR